MTMTLEALPELETFKSAAREHEIVNPRVYLPEDDEYAADTMIVFSDTKPLSWKTLFNFTRYAQRLTHREVFVVTNGIEIDTPELVRAWTNAIPLP